MTRKKPAPEQPLLVPTETIGMAADLGPFAPRGEPATFKLADLPAGMEGVISKGAVAFAVPIEGSTQVERIAALAAAREDGEKEGTIAGMAEAAAIAYRVHEGGGDDDGSLAATAGSEILAELHRRYPGDPRVAHHLKMRGLT